jgi:hypothetical protein
VNNNEIHRWSVSRKMIQVVNMFPVLFWYYKVITGLAKEISHRKGEYRDK